MVDEKSTVVLTIEDKDITDVKEESPPSPPPPEPVKEEKIVAEVPDLLVSFTIIALNVCSYSNQNVMCMNICYPRINV